MLCYYLLILEGFLLLLWVKLLGNEGNTFDLRSDIRRPFKNFNIIVDYLSTGHNATHTAHRCM